MIEQFNDLINKIIFSFLIIFFVYFIKKYLSRSKENQLTETKNESNFVDTQIKRETLLQEKLSQVQHEKIPTLKLSSQINKDLSSEEKEKENEIRQKQLERIFELLKSQDLKPTPNEDFKFSLLKENEGIGDENEVELKNIFDSQLRLYGL